MSFVLLLHHGTHAAELDAAAAAMRDSVNAVPRARLSRAQLKRALPTGFEFEIVYHFESPDYDLFAAAHHGQLVAILKSLDERGIALAAPALATAEVAM